MDTNSSRREISAADSHVDFSSALSDSGTQRSVRLLVIDKTAVLGYVRDRWDWVGSHPEIDLTLLAPSAWIENLMLFRFDPDPRHSYRPVTGRVLGRGRELRSIYYSGLAKAYRESRPDVVIMMEESFSLFGLEILAFHKVFARHTPLVFYSNTVTSYSMPGYRLARLYSTIGRIVTPQCALGLCVNDVALKVLEDAGFDVPSRTLFYGIDEERFSPGDRGTARTTLGISQSELVILYLGRLMQMKGVQDLIAAVRRVQREKPEAHVRLMIVGSGPYEEELKACADAADGMGPVPEIEFRPMVNVELVPDYLRAADILVLPSRKEINEQFGRVLAEGMLVGTSVVGSTSGGVAGVIGDGGYLFEASDVDDLADQIIRIIDHPEEAAERRERGRARALTSFSTRSFVHGIWKLVGELTDRKELVDERLSLQTDRPVIGG